jgi:hypothetical protein
MAAAKMTPAEYEAFKKKTGHREPQKVTTYYEENKKNDEGLKHHAERREHNRKLRDKQMPVKAKVHKAVEKLAPAGRWLKTKIGQVAENARANGGGPSGFVLAPPSMGGGLDFSMGPFGPEPRRRRAPTEPRPGSRSRKQRRAPASRREPEDEGPGWQAMGQVPENVRRWMF